MSQEAIALSIVLLTALYLVWKGFRQHLAKPLSEWLLHRGQVKLAMRVRRLWKHAAKKKSSCGNCN